MDYLDFTDEVSRWSTSNVENETETCGEKEEINKLFHKSPQFGLAGRIYNKVLTCSLFLLASHRHLFIYCG